ncbi:putative mitotubule-associated protein Gb4 [Leptomonas seymouri]|uniref:Putative mitotubule-associated protein Gb4 n=1 Tax=Leptomonas seymouri TaxID=5684 RepID=A0A0N0P2V2_LEPSE|nr:putative mitotubule-associated protein Gb4 [Leptomonas seymouri]|eukprot:KPI82927.1 putative mitotubule-associated protein Gb4 [Leptomonas seymouri]
MMHFSASYHKSINEADLRVKVDEHPYESVWMLYEKMENEVNSIAATTLVKRFDGTDWDLAIESHPKALEEAFREDTAAVLQTDVEHVKVDRIVVGNCAVHFRVSGVDISVEKIMALVSNYAYPKVWALYISRDSASRRTSTHPSSTRASRKVDPLVVEEGLQPEDSMTYLRKALADVRRERDMYMEQVEQAEKVQRASHRRN